MHTVEIMGCIAKNLFIYSNEEKGENVKIVFFNSKKKTDFLPSSLYQTFFPWLNVSWKKT